MLSYGLYIQLKLLMEDSAIKLLMEKQITNDQYKIIDDYKKMAENLEKQQLRNRSNESKLQELQKKILSLQIMNSTAARESTRYQRKLEKLETTQNYATQLLKLKYKSFVEMEKQHHVKHEECLSKREELAHHRQLSQSVYDRRKNEKIRRQREEDQRISMDHRRRSSELEELTRERKEEVREQELRLRDRKKKYEMFKLQRAALNYNQKLEQEVSRYQEKSKYLLELRKKAKKEEAIFMRTQILNRETAKIELIYLTGSER